MATIDTVKDVLAENLDLDKDQITEDATMEALGIDSLDMMELRRARGHRDHRPAGRSHRLPEVGRPARDARGLRVQPPPVFQAA